MRDWRPQRFGRRSARQIDDPLIEPVWSGVRVLVHVRDGRVALVDDDGHEPEQIGSDTIDAMARAVLATEVILDGYLTTQIGSGVGVFSGTAALPQASAGDMARQMLLGRARGPQHDAA